MVNIMNDKYLINRYFLDENQFNKNNLKIVDYSVILQWITQSANFYIREIYEDYSDLICNSIVVNDTIFELISNNIDVYIDQHSVQFINNCITFDVFVSNSNNIDVYEYKSVVSFINKYNKPLNIFKLNYQFFRPYIYNMARKHYNDCESYYHTINHIDNMLANLDLIVSNFVMNPVKSNLIYIRDYDQNLDLRIMYFAICYHDGYYNIIDNDCELKSTYLVRDDFKHLYGDKNIENVINVIMSTKYSTPCPNNIYNNLIHDLDFMYFAKYEDLCIANCQIQNEFLRDFKEELSIEDKFDMFKQGRIKFLKSLKDVVLFKSKLTEKLFNGLTLDQINENAQNNIKQFLAEQYNI